MKKLSPIRASLTVSGILALTRTRRLLLLVGLAFAALPAGSALADTTIGETGGTNDCGANFAYGDTHYVVPAGGGTITSFSYRKETFSGFFIQSADFLVLRPAGGLNYTVVGHTGVVDTPAEPGLETYPASIAVQGGDILGLWTGPWGLNSCVRLVGSGGSLTGGPVSAPPVPGQTLSFTFSEDIFDLNESATFVALPTSLGQCMNDGWKSFGTTFKNQGDCVAFVASGGRKPPSGS